MFKVIEGVYHKGKICIPQFIEMRDETKVLIVFTDNSDESVNINKPSVELPVTNYAESNKLKLEDIDVTISTKEKYKKELLIQNHKDKENPLSGFFSSKPINIGYTDADMLDGIIGGTKN